MSGRYGDRIWELERLRQEVHLRQEDAAAYFHRRSYQTFAAWANGESRPPEDRTRRPMLGFLWDKLQLRRNEERFKVVWQIIVEDWGWEPLADEDWLFLKPGTAQRTAEESRLRTTPAILPASSSTTAPRPTSLSHDHREYLHRLFQQPWAKVPLADIEGECERKRSPHNANLLDVYVPLKIDFSVTVMINDGRVQDEWWGRQESRDRPEESWFARGNARDLRLAQETEQPKQRTWDALRVGENDLAKIVGGIRRKVAGRGDREQKYEDGPSTWYMETQDAASVQKRFVLLGDPGTGKSSFLRHLALCHAGELCRRAGDTNVPDEANLDRALNQDWLLGPLTPVYVPMAELVRYAFPPLPGAGESTSQPVWPDLFWSYVRNHILSDDLAPLAAELRSLSEHAGQVGDQPEERVLLLLDGLDEISQAKDRRVQVQDMIQQLSAACPGARIVVTSRKRPYESGAWQLDGFGVAGLVLLSMERLGELAAKLFACLDTAGGDDKAQRFMAEIKRADPRGQPLIDRSLVATPLFFTLMAAVWLEGEKLPEGKGALYRESVDLLLERWTRRRLPDPSVAHKLRLTGGQLRSVMESLACTVHDQIQAGNSDARFKASLIAQLLFRAPEIDANPRVLGEFFEQHAGILVAPGSADDDDPEFQFLHRSFQEHLAACELTCQNPDTRRPKVPRDRRFPAGLLQRYQAAPELWENVVELAADQLMPARESDLARQLLDLSRPYAKAGEAGRAALLSMRIAHRYKLLSCNEDFDILTGLRGCLRATATRALTDLQFSPEERDVAGELLGEGPRSNGGTLIWPSPGHDQRPGVGLRPDGSPDIDWVFIPCLDPVSGKAEFIYQEAEERTEAEFWMARYPVTYSQYEAFVRAEDGYCADRWWETTTQLPLPMNLRTGPEKQRFSYWNHPRENVNWFEALAFCRWLTAKAAETRDWLGLGAPSAGNRWEVLLPTEWQWEKAARGHDGRKYPWGPTYVTGHANIDETVGEAGKQYLQKTSAVGMYPLGKSPYEVMDLSGNVWEWCLNEYEHPENMKVEDVPHVLRGGSWSNNVDNASALDRDGYWSNDRSDNVGFRVVAVAVPSVSGS